MTCGPKLKPLNKQTKRRRRRRRSDIATKINKDFKTKKEPSLQYNLYTFAKFPVCLFEPSVDLIMAVESCKYQVSLKSKYFERDPGSLSI